MKKSTVVSLGALLTCAMLAGCGSSETASKPAADTTQNASVSESSEETAKEESTEEAKSAWEPSGTITFNISSKAGGNSDLFARTIADICTKEGLVKPTIVINNNSDGGGNIVRIETHDTSDPDNTLLCFSSGDMQSMLSSDIGLTVTDFNPLATLAADKQLIFASTNSKYQSFDDIMSAIESGTKLNVGGTKSNEMTAFNMFADELGKADGFNYMMYDSSSESITALMGDHIELAMGSPAAAISYVESGDITPVVALSSERFEAPLDTAPTMEELGYKTVENPMWRGVIASASMSEEAQQYWSDVFKKVSESDAWKEYLNKYLLSPYYNDLETTRQIMTDANDAYLADK